MHAPSLRASAAHAWTPDFDVHWQSRTTEAHNFRFTYFLMHLHQYTRTDTVTRLQRTPSRTQYRRIFRYRTIDDGCSKHNRWQYAVPWWHENTIYARHHSIMPLTPRHFHHFFSKLSLAFEPPAEQWVVIFVVLSLLMRVDWFCFLGCSCCRRRCRASRANTTAYRWSIHHCNFISRSFSHLNASSD
jgi:hypothetical protein